MKLLIKTSSNLYIYWNIGSLIIMNMMIQLIIGIMLSINYFFLSSNMFNNSFNIYYNMNYGWMMRFFHSNMTSMIFILMLIHINRSLTYKNYMNLKMWMSGFMMMSMMMMISFMGYTLIMNQMSYWASMVITNFIMILPIIGKKMMLLIWGNKFINNILMNRFFSIHFIMSMMTMMMSLIHLIILHKKKSNNPININNKLDQLNLNPMLIFKDMMMMIMFMLIFMMMNMIIPMKMNNPDNFNKMMMFKTPNHIEPEWYFLFFYSILRSNKNKLNGLIIMTLSLMIWIFIPYINKNKIMSNKFMMMNKMNLFMLINIMMIIKFLGTKMSKNPYKKMIKLFIIIYFKLIMMMMMINYMINNYM